MNKTIIIVKTGSSFAAIVQQAQDFDSWIHRALSSHVSDIAISVLHAQHSPRLPNAETIAAVIITGSHAMVTDKAAWSERLIPWLQSLHDQSIPLLGICYGHQLIAHALGGKVDYHPRGIEIGTHQLQLQPAAHSDPLFQHLPAQFPAHLVHRQTVLTLPREAVVLASNAHEPHQAYRVGQTTWGVQFHPEFDEYIMHAYVQQLMDEINDEGVDIQAITGNIRATVESASLLPRFAQLVRECVKNTCL